MGDAAGMEGSSLAKIFVGGLDRSVDEGVVRNFFSQFGPVLEVLVMRDPHNHQSRGFGFVSFQREDSAKQVLQNRYHDMLGKRVEVKSAVPRGQAPPPQRGPPRSSQGYGYARGGGPGSGYGYGGGGPGYGSGSAPWGAQGGYDAQKQGGYAYSDNKSEPPSHGWSEHTAPEGYVYYYNSKTGVSQWERPSEMQ